MKRMYGHIAVEDITLDSLELSKKIILTTCISEYRNKGIGRMLMNAAKSFAEEGVTVLSCQLL